MGLVDPDLQKQTDLPQGQGHSLLGDIQGNSPLNLQRHIVITLEGQGQFPGQGQAQGHQQQSQIQIIQGENTRCHHMSKTKESIESKSQGQIQGQFQGQGHDQKLSQNLSPKDQRKDHRDPFHVRQLQGQGQVGDIHINLTQKIKRKRNIIHHGQAQHQGQ